LKYKENYNKKHWKTLKAISYNFWKKKNRAFNRWNPFPKYF